MGWVPVVWTLMPTYAPRYAEPPTGWVVMVTGTSGGIVTVRLAAVLTTAPAPLASITS